MNRELSPIPNSPPPSPPPSSSSRKRRRSIQTPSSSLSSWRTPKQHQIYSSNLLSALRRLRPSPPTSLAVRSAADRALAIADRGRSRWSRAILSGRGVHLKVRRPKASLPRRGGLRSPTRRSPPAEMEVKARVLGRLVPGCRKMALPTLLDETADYIEALEVQVRAMSMLADVLSGLGGGSPAAVMR